MVSDKNTLNIIDARLETFPRTPTTMSGCIGKRAEPAICGFTAASRVAHPLPCTLPSNPEVHRIGIAMNS